MVNPTHFSAKNFSGPTLSNISPAIAYTSPNIPLQRFSTILFNPGSWHHSFGALLQHPFPSERLELNKKIWDEDTFLPQDVLGIYYAAPAHPMSLSSTPSQLIFKKHVESAHTLRNFSRDVDIDDESQFFSRNVWILIVFKNLLTRKSSETTISDSTYVMLYVCASWNGETLDQECSASGRRQPVILPGGGGRGQWWRSWLGLGPHVTSFRGHVSVLRAGEWNIQACKKSFCWYPKPHAIHRVLEIPACWLGWRWRGWFGSVCRALFALLQARQMHSCLLTVRQFGDLQQED